MHNSTAYQIQISMIIKEIEPFRGTDKFQIAGRQAEEQMAFYLRRYFGDSKDVYVINNLSLGKDGESLQIDHLVIHQNGLIIIESKSVAGKIAITNDLQWIRQYKEFSTGMKSPIIQAEMQKMLLTSIIEELKSEFGEDIPAGNIEIMIAISDNGIIDWSDQGPIDGVYKAENICKNIKLIIGQPSYKKILDEDIEKIKKDIIDMKIISPSQTDYLDPQWRPRGNYPQWIAEFFCDCHVAHMEFRQDIIPGILVEESNARLNKVLDQLDIHYKRKIFEVFTYACIWRKKFRDKSREFLLLYLSVRRKHLYGKAPPINITIPKKTH